MGKKRGAGITRTRYAAFRGADFSTDPSLVESCRSPLCTNIVADGGAMPQKRLGYRTVQSLGDTVYGLFGAEFGGTVKCLAHAGNGEHGALSGYVDERFFAVRSDNTEGFDIRRINADIGHNADCGNQRLFPLSHFPALPISS